MTPLDTNGASPSDAGGRARLSPEVRRSSLSAFAGLALGVVLATGAGAVYLDQVEENVRAELRVEIDAQLQEFLALAGEAVTLYAELSEVLVRKAAESVYIVSAADGSLSVDWETLKTETMSTSVMENLKRRIHVLRSLGDAVAVGIKADVSQARSQDRALFDIAPDRLIAALLVQYPDDAKLTELAARCGALQRKVARLEDPAHWLGRSLVVIRRAVGLPPEAEPIAP